MKPIPIVWTDLEIAFERNAPDVESYIRRSTGEVVTVIRDDREGERWRAIIDQDPDDFVQIEPCASREQYRWMERFVSTVTDEDLRKRLLIAIDGKGAFRRFKDVLLSYPAERERWFNYRAEWLRWHINRWIARTGMETAEPPPWGHDAEPPASPEPLPRAEAQGQGVGDAMRKRVHDAVELLPVGELPAAYVFIEFLRERGSTEFSSGRARLDTNLRRLAAARAAAAQGAKDEAVEDDGDDEPARLGGSGGE